MLKRLALEFFVDPRFPFPNISHHIPKTLGKPQIMVSKSPERRSEFPDDADDALTIVPFGRSPFQQRARMNYPVRGPLTSIISKKLNIRRPLWVARRVVISVCPSCCPPLAIWISMVRGGNPWHRSPGQPRKSSSETTCFSFQMALPRGPQILKIY